MCARKLRSPLCGRPFRPSINCSILTLLPPSNNHALSRICQHLCSFREKWESVNRKSGCAFPLSVYSVPSVVGKFPLSFYHGKHRCVAPKLESEGGRHGKGNRGMETMELQQNPRKDSCVSIPLSPFCCGSAATGYSEYSVFRNLSASLFFR